MKHVYACLLGDWINLTESDAKIMHKLNEFTDPNTWLSEGGSFYTDKYSKTTTFDEYEKIKILYNNKVYSIHPSFIQIIG